MKQNTTPSLGKGLTDKVHNSLKILMGASMKSIPIPVHALKPFTGQSLGSMCIWDHLKTPSAINFTSTQEHHRTTSAQFKDGAHDLTMAKTTIRGLGGAGGLKGWP
jgi:hypothetical protein